MKKRFFSKGWILILSPTVILALILTIFLVVSLFVNMLLCILVEKKFFGNEYDLQGVYVELGVPMNECKIHCVYGNENDFSFEMIGYYDWLLIIPAPEYRCTYMYSVVQHKQDEVDALNEEYADVLFRERIYRIDHWEEQVIRVGSWEAESWKNEVAEYICRLDQIYNFQVNCPEEYYEYFFGDRVYLQYLDKPPIHFSLSEDERLTYEDARQALSRH